MQYALYYQATVEPARTWFFVATLRAHEHLVFDRTLDRQAALFEFFVAPGRAHEFESIMHWYQEQGIIKNFVKKENRLTANTL